jgi:type VII secretion-associated serine protease mycosin
VARLLLAGLVGFAGPVAAAPAVAVAQPDPLPQQARQFPSRAHDQLSPLRAQEAWRYSTGAGVVVAVLDSGVDAEHPALAGRVLPGRDYVDGSTDGRTDPVGHGTTVASLIAGGGDPAIGLAPEATILPVRVLDEQNRYRRAGTVADGVVWAVNQGAQVINLSLGGARDSAALSGALAYAMANDVVVIACTGNLTGAAEEYREVWYPAREPGVVAVAGLTYPDGDEASHWPASLAGPETVLAAPAVMTGAEAGGGYRQVQGTSFASAVVSAAAALIRAQWPTLPAADVVNRLVATAQDLGEPGRDPAYGFGAVDPVAALTTQLPTVPTNPLDTKARQGAAGFGAAPDQPPPAAAAETTEPARETGRDVLIPPAGGSADRPVAAGASGTPGRPVWALLTVATGGLLAAAAVTAIRARRIR